MKRQKQSVSHKLNTDNLSERMVRESTSITETDFQHAGKQFIQSVVSALRAYKAQNPLGFRELISLPEISLKFGWNLREPVLIDLYHSLIAGGYLSSEQSTFRNVFIGYDPIFEKPQWTGQANELVYVFEYLREEKIIAPHSTPHLQLQENFIDRFGRPFNLGSLRTMLERSIMNKNKENKLYTMLGRIFK